MCGDGEKGEEGAGNDNGVGRKEWRGAAGGVSKGYQNASKSNQSASKMQPNRHQEAIKTQGRQSKSKQKAIKTRRAQHDCFLLEL